MTAPELDTARLRQIRQTAVLVAPADVGVWHVTDRPSPANGVVIAPADLAWLANRLAAAERAHADLAAAVEAVLGDPHADTCATALSPDAGYPCSCWQADLRAVLADHTSAHDDGGEGRGCECDRPHLGAQQVGQPVRCERCDGLVQVNGGDAR